MAEDTQEQEQQDTFDSPESSTIARGVYSYGAQVLLVYFTSGKGYAYGGVDSGTWEQFRDAKSKGAFFGAFIRPMYAGQAQPQESYVTVMDCVGPLRGKKIVAVMDYVKSSDDYKTRKTSNPLPEKAAKTLAETWAKALGLDVR